MEDAKGCGLISDLIEGFHESLAHANTLGLAPAPHQPEATGGGETGDTENGHPARGAFGLTV